jgi:predicted nucleic acid-binding protein
MPVVVSDAGPLIAFIDAGAFDLLAREFEEILVPREVKVEVFERRPRAKPRQVKVTILDDPTSLARFAELRARLDPGEAAAVALAEHRRLPLLVDERAGSIIAAELSIVTICTADVLRSLVANTAISKKQARAIVRTMRENGTYLPDVSFIA